MSQLKRQRSPLDGADSLIPRDKRPALLSELCSSDQGSSSSFTSSVTTPGHFAANLAELQEQLREIQVLLTWQPKALAPYAQSREPIREVTLHFNDDYCLVRASDGNDIGVLENRALNALGALIQDNSPVKYEAVLLEPQNRDDTTSTPSQSRKGKLSSIDINVFGPRYKADEVARGLGNAKLFLQRPSRFTIQLYENPQCLDLPFSISEEKTHLTSVADMTSRVCKQPAGTDDENAAFNVDRIIDGVNQSVFSGIVDIDSRICTKLHLYQRKGVEFILSRESGQLSPSQSLWEPLSPDQGLKGYRHVITGAKSRNPEDGSGGILADDMGLGKTLMMITAIIGSFNRTQECESQMLSSSANHRPIMTMNTTLIVVPSELLLASWTKEIESHTLPGTVRYYKYHGKYRTDNASIFSNYCMVLTTYGTIAADFRKQKATLSGTQWYRIILDEAHIIRNWSTKQFSAVNDIPARIRWCVTGTPIQNGLEDLGSLVRFLRVPMLQDMATFRKFICSDSGSSKAMKQNFPNLQLLLGSICLRRTQALLELRSTMHTIRLDFSEDERNEYRIMEAVCQRAIAVAVNSGKSKASHQHVLEKLLHLREFCNGITSTASKSPDKLFNIMEQSGETRCAYCSADITGLDTVDEACYVQLTECGQFICSDMSCMLQYSHEIGNSKTVCPFCDVSHWKVNVLDKPEDQSCDREVRLSYPTKLLRLLEDVKMHFKEEKCIIFSVWKRTLDLVESLFSTNGILYSRVDGSVSTATKRKKILLEFRNREDMRVLLITLGTGAVGLNDLSVASRVYLIEPQWNPSVERQAIGRVLRLGQEREVKIIRYIMRSSIEELVERRQKHKLQLASGGFNISQLAQDLHDLRHSHE